MRKLLLCAILLCSFNIALQAQTTVTFNINLQPMLEDSTFVPGRDVVQVVGNFYPLGANKSVQMHDQEPVDSVYTAEIEFSRRFDNQELKYNYEIITPNKKISESATRRIRLQGGQVNLPPLYFDDFAI